MIKTFYSAVAAVALMPAAAMAGSGSVSGSKDGLTWTAASHIVGQTSTATTAGGGSGTYLAHDDPKYNGVVQLRMNYGAAGAFVCSGSLTSSGRIVTAAHCISNGYSSNVNGKDAALLSTTAYFYSGTGQGTDPLMQSGGAPNAGVVAVAVSGYNTHYGYTGEVIDQNDIAVLTLATAAPAFATKYDLYTGPLTGATFNVAGYGLRSDVGGSNGYDAPNGLGTGRLREGENRYDYAWGNPLFQGFFTDRDASGENFFGTAQIEHSYISDFDNGLSAQSQSRRVANALGLGAIGNTYFNDNGLGAREVSIAGGDSGGPGFINGQLASVNSYGLTFGTNFGDAKGGLQSSFGELNGFVPIFLHTGFIGNVPEPSTWALLLLGFGVAGAAMRRKSKVQARYAF